MERQEGSMSSICQIEIPVLL